jgi:hypothetical protein
VESTEVGEWACDDAEVQEGEEKKAKRLCADLEAGAADVAVKSEEANE